MPSRHRTLPLSCALLLAAGTLQGCKEEEPGKLFDEEGVWSLQRYDTGDGVQTLNPSTQKDAFLLKFEPGPKVVTAAACGMALGVDDVPRESICRQNPSSTGWFCRCFAYAYEEDLMQWREFTAGEPPPSVDFEPPTAAEGGGGDSTGGGGGDSYITLSVIDATPSKDYAFVPLPMGVFGSDGATSRYEFIQRAGMIFEGSPDDDNAPATDPQAMCTPCVN